MYSLLIQKCLTQELHDLEDLLKNKTTEHKCQLISEMSHYLVSAGGKRIRPIIFLLMVRCFGYQGMNHINLAAVLELIHTATLLHDDIIDNSSMRRNKVSAHIKWQVRDAVTVGDWLFSLAFKLTVACKNINITKIVADMTKSMAKGELAQLLYKDQSNINEQSYFDVIEAKTGLLFAVATEMSALLCRQEQHLVYSARQFGLHMGLAFQIQDDLLDFLGNAESLGKNLGDDIAEGKLTLPMIHLRERNIQQFNKIVSDFKNLPAELVKTVLTENGCISYTQGKAIQQQELAFSYLEQLPANEYRDCLYSITQQITERDC